ncbi:TIGR02234 family membrane protein [Nocardia arthritidis]|uniref:TIGR02234 family membrane protein n=1 Tax=Nocardia arthritidis TaxID=228602 RepID=A0A6G9YDB9_9NOCA|nr:TIGR02234 family membrane protein [Nocardia arthritidis]QIS11067.1 TIGR02234 family membrane protein [Nocardia arthritidis]
MSEPGAAQGKRRYPVVPVLLLAVAAGLMWLSSRLTWVTIHSEDGLTVARTNDLNGGTWFGALTPLALVLLAAIAAVLATRGWLRRIFGVLIGLVAAVTAVPGFALLLGKGATADRAKALAELPGRAMVTDVLTHPFPPSLTLLATVAAGAAAVLLARMPEQTARLSGKYDNPVFRRAAATAEVAKGQTQGEVTERVLWDALDAGADPTADDAGVDPKPHGGSGDSAGDGDRAER